jgi:competence protein ComEA
MAEPQDRQRAEPAPPILRRQDQCVIAAITFAALLGMAVYWLAQGGLSGHLVEVRDAKRQTASFNIDINRAAWPEFTLLPDIGETLARRIVESREKDGPFRSHDDLGRVRGIGSKTLEKLRPYLAPIDSAD